MKKKYPLPGDKFVSKLRNGGFAIILRLYEGYGFDSSDNQIRYAYGLRDGSISGPLYITRVSSLFDFGTFVP